MWTVKEVIDKSGMTLEEFGSHYEIPIEKLKEWYSVNYISKYAFKGCKNLDEQSRQKILSLAPETEFE